jgi:hypothetical protein
MSSLPTISKILEELAVHTITRGRAHELIITHISQAVTEAMQRDQFAMHAMPILYAQDVCAAQDVQGYERATFDEIADDAFRMADAMLRARGGQ